MKAALFFLVSLMGLQTLGAQEVNCAEKQKELTQFVKDGKYREATELLSLLRKKCAARDEALYPQGITVLKHNVEVASADSKQAAITDLVKFYDQYDANFPANKNGNAVNKAMLIYENNGPEAEVYTLLDKAFTANPDQFTTANSLYVYFKLYNENYRKSKDASLDALLDKYSQVVVAIGKNGAAIPERAAEFNNAKGAAKAMVKEFLVPERIVAMAEKGFEANKQNVQWLESTANLLSEKSAGTPIFGKVANQLHELKPTAQSAYHLGNYQLKNRNQKQAITYFEQAATLQANPAEKARLYYNTAAILAGPDPAEAKRMIGLAVENNPKNGSYYILLANLYANAVEQCSTNVLQQKAVYQLANQTAQKAAQAEPRMKATADALSKEYSKNKPTAAELDQIKKAGGKVKIDCWINETVSF